mmetsp:Transcript_63143/g.137263  ORF Transcript_63143/g.137263 Transcript_63143/m.137263 type:complete len:200 (+) Transcript_63143:406-1005(+)
MVFTLASSARRSESALSWASELSIQPYRIQRESKREQPGSTFSSQGLLFPVLSAWARKIITPMTREFDKVSLKWSVASAFTISLFFTLMTYLQKRKREIFTATQAIRRQTEVESTKELPSPPPYSAMIWSALSPTTFWNSGFSSKRRRSAAPPSLSSDAPSFEARAERASMAMLDMAEHMKAQKKSTPNGTSRCLPAGY